MHLFTKITIYTVVYTCQTIQSVQYGNDGFYRATLWLCLSVVLDIFPFIFMLETCVQFDVRKNKKMFEIFKGSLHIIWIICRDQTLKKIPDIRIYTCFQHKNEGENVWHHKWNHNSSSTSILSIWNTLYLLN